MSRNRFFPLILFAVIILLGGKSVLRERKPLNGPLFAGEPAETASNTPSDADSGAGAEAERSRPIPCVDQPETLRPLDPADPIWVTPDRKSVVLVGRVCLREGLLELFACRRNSKEHESILSLDIKPYLIHAALLVIGAKKGAPVRYAPEFIPPSGEEIEIRVRWRDADGTLHDYRAQELVRQADSRGEMTDPWVFTGGVMGKDSQNKSYYTADVTGEIIGVSNFAGTVLDLPIESTADNNALLFEPYTERIPEIDTEVTVILTGTGRMRPSGKAE